MPNSDAYVLEATSMKAFFKQYNQRLQHQHGWEVELRCLVCGNHGLPDYTGWTPDSIIHFGTQPTVFAKSPVHAGART
jgi:hypothetical protein